MTRVLSVFATAAVGMELKQKASVNGDIYALSAAGPVQNAYNAAGNRVAMAVDAASNDPVSHDITNVKQITAQLKASTRYLGDSVANACKFASSCVDECTNAKKAMDDCGKASVQAANAGQDQDKAYQDVVVEQMNNALTVSGHRQSAQEQISKIDQAYKEAVNQQNRKAQYEKSQVDERRDKEVISANQKGSQESAKFDMIASSKYQESLEANDDANKLKSAQQQATSQLRRNAEQQVLDNNLASLASQQTGMVRDDIGRHRNAVSMEAVAMESSPGNPSSVAAR